VKDSRRRLHAALRAVHADATRGARAPRRDDDASARPRRRDSWLRTAGSRNATLTAGGSWASVSAGKSGAEGDEENESPGPPVISSALRLISRAAKKALGTRCMSRSPVPCYSASAVLVFAALVVGSRQAGAPLWDPTRRATCCSPATPRQRALAHPRSTPVSHTSTSPALLLSVASRALQARGTERTAALPRCFRRSRTVAAVFAIGARTWGVGAGALGRARPDLTIGFFAIRPPRPVGRRW